MFAYRVQDDSWIPEDQSTEDQNSALDLKDRDLGLFLLYQDKECRAILCKIIWDGQDLLASNLQEYLVQVQAGGRVSRSQRGPVGLRFLLPCNICSYNNHHKYFTMSIPPTKQKKTQGRQGRNC